MVAGTQAGRHQGANAREAATNTPLPTPPPSLHPNTTTPPTAKRQYTNATVALGTQRQRWVARGDRGAKG